MKADYAWEGLYETAVLETDDEKLQKCIRAAKAAIDVRLQEIQLDHGGTPEERRAITDALTGLNALRRELERRTHDTIVPQDAERRILAEEAVQENNPTNSIEIIEALNRAVNEQEQRRKKAVSTSQ